MSLKKTRKTLVSIAGEVANILNGASSNVTTVGGGVNVIYVLQKEMLRNITAPLTIKQELSGFTPKCNCIMPTDV
jgi:hypothetical protein